MRRSRLIASVASAVLIPLSALALAACGGSAATASRPASTSTATAKTSSTASATVGVANSGLGSILVDSRGRTLYLWLADTGAKSTCSGACATAWGQTIGQGSTSFGAPWYVLSPGGKQITGSASTSSSRGY